MSISVPVREPDAAGRCQTQSLSTHGPDRMCLRPANSLDNAADRTHDVGGTQSSHRTRCPSVRLGVTLFGKANDQLPYVVHALERAASRGLTSKRIKLELFDVQNETQEPEERRWSTIYTPGSSLMPIVAQDHIPPETPSEVRVHLITPLRIKRQGQLAGPSEFDFRTFLGGLLRRISLLTYFFTDTPLETDFSGLLKLASSVPVTNAELHWKTWTRFSSRQDTKLRMDGVVGRFDLIGTELNPFWPYLWYGQWTHVGKGTSMGLGRYELQNFGAADGNEAAGHSSVQGKNDTAGCSRAITGTINGLDCAEREWPKPARL